MTSQAVDIFSMLNKAQTEYNQQQNSVAAFFRQASNGSNNSSINIPPTKPMPIRNVNSLEQIERQIRTSPPSHCKFLFHLNLWLCNNAFYRTVLDDSQNNNNNNNVLQPTQPTNMANSPLAQFFHSNNFNNTGPRRQAPKNEIKLQNEDLPNGPIVCSVPPGFNNKQQKNLLMNVSNKDTKLITPTMFATPNNVHKKPSLAEPLTKEQLLQSLSYLIEHDDEFMRKVHDAYIKSFKNLAS